MKNIKVFAAFAFLFMLLQSFPSASQNQRLRWVTYQGRLPANVVYGGYENNTRLAVCRCTYNGAKHPGKVVNGKCNIGWGGKEIVARNFEVLVAAGNQGFLKWQNVGAQMPNRAVRAGTERGKPLYVGKAFYRNGWHPGKIFRAGNRYICNIGYGGKEISLNSNFQVLTISGQGRRQRPQANNTSGNSPCKQLTGTWRWHSDLAIVLQNNGTVTSLKGEQWGRWSCPRPRQFKVNWNNGKSDVMNIKDNRTMTGRASNGANVQAVRMSQNDIKAYKQAMKYRKDIDNAMDKIGDFLKKKKKNK